MGSMKGACCPPSTRQGTKRAGKPGICTKSEESKQYLRQLYEGWANDAREKAKNFTASIDQKFTDYGFTPSQKLGAVFSANQVLGDVVDAKAKNASKRSLPALQAGQISMKYNGNASDLKVPDRRAKAQMSDLQLNTLQNT